MLKKITEYYPQVLIAITTRPYCTLTTLKSISNPNQSLFFKLTGRTANYKKSINILKTFQGRPTAYRRVGGVNLIQPVTNRSQKGAYIGRRLEDGSKRLS
ncbi:hypothetical protein DSO57_1001935 [Entomophthora muscae]|uniref:Uncharacterized protein n=1 Tax=Entomophthora muscae TaxID=34485 RepID=A0ACC2UUL6_9FUNG|nr:hypothetical protein DSO57_1001935 [Entomophthora muscae]